MVIDPNKKVIKRTIKSYEPFIKTEKKERVPFEWEQIDDVTLHIRIINMEKNFYETPTIKVVAVDEQSIICTSTERLEENTFNWNEGE